jgi:hypothetical protein
MAVSLHRFMERLFGSPQGGVDLVILPPAPVVTSPRRGIPDEYLEKLPPPEERDMAVLVAHDPPSTWRHDLHEQL